jgi:hypothetical protein
VLIERTASQRVRLRAYAAFRWIDRQFVTTAPPQPGVLLIDKAYNNAADEATILAETLQAVNGP